MMCHIYQVEKTNALKMRQNLGKVLLRLDKTGLPVLIERNRKPAAVMISLEDYQKRFVDYEADNHRNEVVQIIKQAKIRLPKGKTSIQLIRHIRNA